MFQFMNGKLSPKEALRHIGLGVEVAGRVEGQGGYGRSAVRVVSRIGVDAADGPECPSGGVTCVGDASCRGLEEVEAVLGRTVHAARQYEEPLQQETAGQEEQGRQAKEGTCSGKDVCDARDGCRGWWCGVAGEGQHTGRHDGGGARLIGVGEMLCSSNCRKQERMEAGHDHGGHRAVACLKRWTGGDVGHLCRCQPLEQKFRQSR